MNRMNKEPYSILMSVYSKEKKEYLIESVDSMLAQTYPADEIVLVKDGPLTKELDKVLDDYAARYPDIFHFVCLEKNMGLGTALQQGILACKNEWIVRMDTDDYSVPERCERQFEVLEQNPTLDMICSNYYEFSNADRSSCVLRQSPEKHEDIIRFAKRRNPFGHCCMLYRKSKVLSAGNYNGKFLQVEDYDLWIRMFLKGCKAYNIQEPLVYVRGNENFYNRRGGISYWKKIMAFLKEHRRTGFFSRKDYFVSCAVRTVVYLVPGNVRAFIYKKFLRRKADR